MTDQAPNQDQGEIEQPPAEGGSTGSIKVGPLIISAKLSVILIVVAVILFNLLLALGVVLAALYRAGRL